MMGSTAYNPELGFYGYVDTVAYRMDVEPSLLEEVETLAVIRQVFLRNGTHSEAEAAVRRQFDAKGRSVR